MTRFAPSLVLLLLSLSAGAQAVTLFADNEARQELLNLRQRITVLERLVQDEARARRELADQLKAQADLQAQEQARRKELEQSAQAALERATKWNEEQSQMRRGSLELLNQIEQLRQELARLRGDNEALKDFVAGFQRGLADMRQSQSELRNNLGGVQAGLLEVQRNVKDSSAQIDERIRRVEPVKVTVDGREFETTPAEAEAFDAAVKLVRSGENKSARTAFDQFLARYPASSYRPWVLYWLGTSQYATEDFKAAQTSFRAVLRDFPSHPRAGDAMLGLASVQSDLKEPRATVRKTLEDLIKAYPDSGAASAARERLSKFK
jgi:tol-pal system protein YbgF